MDTDTKKSEIEFICVHRFASVAIDLALAVAGVFGQH